MKNYFPFIKFMKKYRTLIGFSIIGLGVFIALLGSKYIDEVFLSFGGLFFTQLGLIIYQKLHPENPNPDFIWIIVLIFFCIGAFFSFIFSKFAKVVLISIGGFLGYMLSSIVYAFIKAHLINKNNPEIYFVLTILSCVGFGCILAILFNTEIVILATAFIGSFLLTRGLSYFFEGFPNSTTISNLINRGKFDELAGVIYY